MTIEKLLEKYKRKYPGVPYERSSFSAIGSRKNNEFHSYDDAPAIVYRDGTKLWKYKGVTHRENDKPAFIDSDGTKYWYYKGGLHREDDRPAIIRPNEGGEEKEWWYNNKRHRENDKPAIIYSNGKKEYWYEGKKYNETPEIQKKQIEKLTAKKSSKQKQREDLLKEFVCEIKSIYIIK